MAMIGGRGGAAEEKSKEKLTGLVRTAGRGPHRQIMWAWGAWCVGALFIARRGARRGGVLLVLVV